MKEICFVELPSPGSYGGIYSELICALVTSFTKFGVRVSYQSNRLNPKIPNLVFAWYRKYLKENTRAVRLPPNCVVFNLAPLSASETFPWLQKYTESLAYSPVIDYSTFNESLIHELGNTRTFRFLFGYTKLSPFQYPDRKQNLLFYGRVNAHRKPVLEKIIANGTSLKVISDIWGHERDLQIGMAHSVINIGKHDRSILETYRLWHCLCLGTPIISERGIDAVLTEEWDPYVKFIDGVEEVSSSTSFPDPKLYQQQTSFDEEAYRLMQWINSLKLN